MNFSGNWAVDLQAGSQFGYHLLFVILVSGIFATFLQVLIPLSLILAMEFRLSLFVPFFIGFG